MPPLWSVIRRNVSFIFIYDGEPVELLHGIYSVMTCSITPSVSLRVLHHTCTQTHLIHICTKPCLRRTPPLGHLQDSQSWTFFLGQLVIMRLWSGSWDQQESHFCLSNLIKTHAYMKCSCIPYSDVSTAATTRVLPVLSLSLRLISRHEQSVCKDKHPSYTISHF